MTTIPTIGFNVESVTYKNLNFNVWVRKAPPFPFSSKAQTLRLRYGFAIYLDSER